MCKSGARQRHLVGSPDETPQLDGGFERLPGPRRVTAGSRTRPSAIAALAASALLSNSCGHAGEFVGRVAGTDEVSGSDLDLDPGGEQRSPAQVGVRRQLLGRDGQGMVERVADGCRRQRNVALSQSQQGESRLRIPPRFASREERLLRAVEITQLES